MRPGICTIAAKDRSVDEAIELAAQAGAETIELWGRAPHLPPLGDLVAYGRLGKKIRDAGLRLEALGSYYRPDSTTAPHPVATDPGSEEESPAYVLEAAVRLQASIVRIWAGTKNFSEYKAAERVVIMRQIIRFAELASEEGLTVVLERHNNTLTNSWDTTHEAVSRIREQVEHPELFGLCYQVPYPVPVNEFASRFAADVESLLPLTLHSHLQNYAAMDPAPDDNRFPRTLLDSGLVDYGAFSKACATSGFSGSAMVEFVAVDRGNLSELDALKRDVEYIRTL